MFLRLFACAATSLFCLVSTTAQCGPVPASVVEKPALASPMHMLAVDGTVSYRERIALPPGYTLVVRLLDVSRQDAPATEVARVELSPDRQVPVPFRLEVEEARIDERMTYAVEATIFVDGQRRFITDTLYTVLTRGKGHRVHLVLVGAGVNRGPAATPKSFVLPDGGASPVTGAATPPQKPEHGGDGAQPVPVVNDGASPSAPVDAGGVKPGQPAQSGQPAVSPATPPSPEKQGEGKDGTAVKDSEAKQGGGASPVPATPTGEPAAPEGTSGAVPPPVPASSGTPGTPPGTPGTPAP
ncbi:YbaY family lipoprotein [Nitratidesulfovibrio vulgaris]|uniref:Lipoprotein n=1 Tax=Nitratidesulfovibrio vulgaris (strain DP4) TaxID=391774 RepID=A0A0H3ABE7_NITV4|nr:YbaY family lipoprotein [Nitratidesulfovibrio vulgaris]ABM29642.1 conserved hypothetical protein [Nitratidesulfovibrio vulgaris DP4]GEB80108.1 hypothetical protein DDE01_15230 [Desulfovibrio desulfuricans]